MPRTRAAPGSAPAWPTRRLARRGRARGGAPEADAQQLEALLGRTLERWSADRSAPEQISTGRLASLRRRFHELGAGNPFAVEEDAELRARLGGARGPA